MKATKLIEILNYFVEKFGDQEVLLADWSEEYSRPISCDEISYKCDENFFDINTKFKEGFVLDSK